MRFVDLFAGAGGFGLGFQAAGFEPILSVERDRNACQTLAQNNTHEILNADIKTLDSKAKIWNHFSKSPDVIIGGPPCQGFSVAASNRLVNGDSRNSLFKQFLNWVAVLNPKAFVMENVTGILTRHNTRGQKVIDTVIKEALKLGYNTTVWKLNAADFGVPQNRVRVFIIGTKNDFSLKPPVPKHSDKPDSKKSRWVTVGEAILDLPKIFAHEGSEEMAYDKNKLLTKYQKWSRRKSKKVFNHVAMKHTQRVVDRYSHIILHQDRELPDDLKVRMRNGNGKLSKSKFNLNYRYLDPGKVAYTIPASFYSSFIHPHQPRNITAREAARLQSFPDWYQFMGSRTLISDKLLIAQGREELIALSQYNQIGNAVPPLLAKAVAKRLHYYLSKVR